MARMPQLQSACFSCHLGCRSIRSTFNAFRRVTLTSISEQCAARLTLHQICTGLRKQRRSGPRCCAVLDYSLALDGICAESWDLR